jgi:FkbM family methyltransferase
MLFDKASTYGAFISQTGILKGSSAVLRRLLGQLYRDFSTRSEYPLRIKGFTNPIYIRLPTSDWTVFFQVFIRQEYQEPSKPHSEAMKSLYDAILGQGKNPVIIDCGANIGLSSLWYAANFPKAIVVAVEPEQHNFSLLLRNSSENDQIIPVRAGISARPTKLCLSNTSGEPWAWETIEDDEGIIDGITIIEAINKVENAVPIIVKIDIEGFEAELFRSNIDWISQVPLIAIETHDWLFAWKGSGHAVFSAITKAGPRDYIQNGENTLCYSHELLRNYHA